MSYKLIKGSFHIYYPDLPNSGPEPDGDTLKFKPDNPELVSSLKQSGSSPGFNRRGMINLRFEGIDALELHFDDSHQKLSLAESARDRLLEIAGFGQVQFNDRPGSEYKVKSAENHPVRGYILATSLDTYGRIISFVFTGDVNFLDGSSIEIDQQMLKSTINAKLLAEGLVYPAFYSSLATEHRKTLTDLAVRARNNRLGVWPVNQAAPGSEVTITDLNALEEMAMWPKLYRRLVRYFNAGYEGLGRFIPWLKEDITNRDDRLILPDHSLGNMHSAIEVSNNRIRMLYNPEDLVILPDKTTDPEYEPLLIPEKCIKIIAAKVNPSGSDTGMETVTIINTCPDNIDLQGWCIADHQINKHNLSGLLTSGAVLQITMSDNLRLSNTGDSIALLDPEGKIIDQVSYGSAEGKKEGYTILF